MGRIRFLALVAAVALAACDDTTGVGQVAEVELSLHSDTVWSLGVRSRVSLTVRDSDGMAVPLESTLASWASSDPGVATVEPGLVRPVSAGSTSIRVEVGDFVAERLFTVREDVEFTVSEGLAEAFQWALEDTLTTHSIVGMTAAVRMPDGSTWMGSAGWNAPGEERLKPSTTFPVGSVTKSIVSASAMVLAEEGLLSLDDTVGTWLDSIEHVPPGIGLRQLMSQTSGIAAFTSHPGWAPAIEADLDRAWEPEELLGSFMSEPIFDPGQSYSSSTTNMFLTAMIVRAAAGSSLSEVLRTRLFSPLGLEGTSLPAEEAIRGAPGRVWVVEGDDFVEATQYEAPALFSSRWASSGIYSRADDLAEWGYALFSGAFLTQETLSEMLDFRSTDGVFPIPGLGLQDGSGLGVRSYTLESAVYYGHSGVTTGTSTEMLYDPMTGITTAVIINQSSRSHDFVHFRAALALLKMARDAA